MPAQQLRGVRCRRVGRFAFAQELGREGQSERNGLPRTGLRGDAQVAPLRVGVHNGSLYSGEFGETPALQGLDQGSGDTRKCFV